MEEARERMERMERMRGLSNRLYVLFLGQSVSQECRGSDKQRSCQSVVLVRRCSELTWRVDLSEGDLTYVTQLHGLDFFKSYGVDEPRFFMYSLQLTNPLSYSTT